MNNQQEKTLLPIHQRLSLKKSAHHLKPVVQVGKKGITDSLIEEINLALEAHELIKIQILSRKESFDDDVAAIVQKTEAAHIDTIGHIVILFRKRDKDSQY